MRAVTEHDDVVACQCPTDELGEEAESRTVQVLARTVDVGQAQDDGDQCVAAPVEQMEMLAHQLVDTIHIDRCRRVSFVDGEIPGPPVHLTR